MVSAIQIDENLRGVYERLIAENDASFETIQNNFKTEIEGDDGIEYENCEMELKIEANEKMLIENDRNMFKNLVSIKSRINIAARLNNGKKKEKVISHTETKFAKRVKALSAKSASILNLKEIKNELKTLQMNVDREMDKIKMAENRIAESDAYERRFEYQICEIDDETTVKLEILDVLIGKEQKRNFQNRWLAENGITSPDAPENSFLRHVTESE